MSNAMKTDIGGLGAWAMQFLQSDFFHSEVI